MSKLISEPTGTRPDTLEDLFLCIAGTIEDSLIQANAIPGIDYTRLDIYKLAQPFVLSEFQANPSATYKTQWPRYEQ